MEKQILKAISNKEDYVCYKLEKLQSYFEFFYSLMEEFDMDIPDIQESDGSEPEIRNYFDTSSFYKGEDIEIWEVMGYRHVFLIIKTEERKKLTDFMLENCDMEKPKK